jgi:predicted RNase H-like nuclease (RuvC/YqgF family)
MSVTKSIWDKASMGAAVLGAIASLIAGILTFTLDKFVEIKISESNLIVSQRESPELAKQVDELKIQLAALKSIPKESKISAQLSEFSSKLNRLDSEVKIINKAIMQSPEKALSIPMLRRDIASLKKQYESSTKSLERDHALMKLLNG